MHPAEPPRAARLPLWKRLLYATLVVAVFVSIPEVLFRWGDLDRRLFPAAFEDPYEKLYDGLFTLLTYDPVTFWTGRPLARLPGTHESLNSRGLRGTDFSTQKPNGTQRIVCMGDSSTFGVVYHGDIRFTFNPTYSAELERLLNDGRAAPRVEVINAGVIGYSTLQGLRQLEHLVRYWQPDVITIRYGVNDRSQLDLTYPNVIAEPRNALIRALHDTLLDQRSFQLLIRTRERMLREAVLRLASAPPAKPTAAGPRRPRVPLEEYEHNLRRLVIEGRAAGARVVLLTAPLAPLSPEITTKSAYLDQSGYASFADLVADHQRYEDVVRAVAADLDVDLLDTTRQFAERGPERFFTRYDLPHPSGDGHLAIARDLAELLYGKGIVAR